MPAFEREGIRQRQRRDRDDTSAITSAAAMGRAGTPWARIRVGSTPMAVAVMARKTLASATAPTRSRGRMLSMSFMGRALAVVLRPALPEFGGRRRVVAILPEPRQDAAAYSMPLWWVASALLRSLG